MLRVTHMLRLPVIDGRTGRTVGHVKDVGFDEHWRLTGLILGAARWWFRTVYRAVSWDHVRACGEDAVVITSAEAVRRLARGALFRAFETGAVPLRDLPVVTRDGQQLGRVADVYFTPDVGTPVLGYELTDGFVSDLMEGRKWLRLSADPDEVTLGEDVILVPAQSVNLLETIVT